MRDFSYIAIIGPARTGTTWLHKYVMAHPSAATSHIKELNWFNTAMGLTHPDKPAVFLHRYHRIMARRTANGLGPNAAALQCKNRYGIKTDAQFHAFCHNIAGDQPFVDVTPGYCMLGPAGFERMKSCFSSAKIVLMLRNPADWAWSFSHLLTKDRSDADASDFANNFPDKKIPDPDHAYAPIRQIYDDVSRVFSADEILCLFTEDLFSSTRQQTTVDRLSAFLDVPPYPTKNLEFEKSRGAYSVAPDEFRAQATMRAKEDIAWVRSRMGRLPETWEADCQKYLSD